VACFPRPRSRPIEAIVAGIAGGLAGAFIGCALNGRLPHGRAARALPIAALVAIMAVFADGLWTTVPHDVRAHVKLDDARPAPQREVSATIRIDPPEAAANAAWLNVTAWQGGGLVVDRLEPMGEGVYRTTKPIPVFSDWKSTVRLQRGREVLGLPLYMPRDTAIPAPKVAAKPSFSRTFVSDHRVLQRERKQDVPAWLTTAAPLCVLAIALGFLATLAWGLGRVARPGATPPSARRHRPRPRPQPTSVPGGAG
jgi:hypothetical protein